jgi:integrase/recombinase XerD
VFSTYESQIKKLKEEGQAGTASCYESAYYSFLSYTSKEPLLARKGVSIEKIKEKKDALLAKKKALPFTAVNVAFLSGYEKWMLSSGKTLTSVSMYVQTLRTLFNDVIATGDLDKDLYPFGIRLYQVPAGKSEKNPLYFLILRRSSLIKLHTIVKQEQEISGYFLVCAMEAM